jgi:hypothetical protein
MVLMGTLNLYGVKNISLDFNLKRLTSNKGGNETWKVARLNFKF